jgi:4-amino-4-deoxychorismate lyase
LPLLNGTKRQLLLSNGIINEAQISVDSINDYDRVWLINALLDIEDKISIPVNQIFF